MKKILLLFAFLLFTSKLHANHQGILSANNLTGGTVPNARLDPSSVTLRGQLNDLTQSIRIATFTATQGSVSGSLTANSFIGDGSQLTNVPLVGNATVISSGPYNVLITTNGSNANGVEVTVIQNNYVNGNKIILSTVAAMNKSGAAGMCNGETESASTWYGVWLFANASTMTVCMSSYSVAPPTLTGYLNTRLIGYVGNDSSSNLLPIKQVNKNAFYYTGQLVVNNTNPTTGIGNFLNLYSVVPPNTYTIQTFLKATGSTEWGITITPANHVAIQSGGGGEPLVYGFHTTSSNFYTAQTINIGGMGGFYYGDDGNASALSISINGFQMEGLE